MITRLTVSAAAVGLLLAPVLVGAERERTRMTDDMRRAIAFERHKEAAAARQARIEARNPTVTYTADREAEPQGRVVADPGENQKTRGSEADRTERTTPKK